MAQLIKYVLNDAKTQPVNPPSKWGWYVPGIRLTEENIKQLIHETADTNMLKEYRAFNGTLEAFIEKQITTEKERNMESLIFKNHIRARSMPGYIREFEANEAFRVHKRSNSVLAYHHIISFSQKDRAQLNGKILKDIARQYISLRGPTSLFVGAVHTDKQHAHIHLIQSGVDYCTGRASRTSRQDFQELKVAMHAYQLQHHPQLVHSLPNITSQQSKKQNMEHIKNIKTNERASKKQDILKVLKTTYEKSTSTEHFLGQLKEMGHEPYFRGDKPQGIKYDGDLKFRFSQLGYTAEKLNELDIRNEKNENDLKEIQQLRGKPNSRIIEIEKKEKDMRSGESIDISKYMCEDCQKEKQDPTYLNPRLYIEGALDFNKYNEHMTEELMNVLSNVDIKSFNVHPTPNEATEHENQDNKSGLSEEIEEGLHEDKEKESTPELEKDTDDLDLER